MKSFYLFLITITICIATSKPAYSSPDKIDQEEIDENVAQVAEVIMTSLLGNEIKD